VCLLCAGGNRQLLAREGLEARRLHWGCDRG
jgi:hypothetical protein